MVAARTSVSARQVYTVSRGPQNTLCPIGTVAAFQTLFRVSAASALHLWPICHRARDALLRLFRRVRAAIVARFAQCEGRDTDPKAPATTGLSYALCGGANSGCVAFHKWAHVGVDG